MLCQPVVLLQPHPCSRKELASTLLHTSKQHPDVNFTLFELARSTGCLQRRMKWLRIFYRSFLPTFEYRHAVLFAMKTSERTDLTSLKDTERSTGWFSAQLLMGQIEGLISSLYTGAAVLFATLTCTTDKRSFVAPVRFRGRTHWLHLRKTDLFLVLPASAFLELALPILTFFDTPLDA